MTLPEHTIRVRDLTSKALNSKEEILRSGKIKKPFIFKGYKTEKDRIEETIKNNNYLNNTLGSKSQINLLSNEKKDIFNFNIQNSLPLLRKASIVISPKNLKYVFKNDSIIQPQMRFKPRTDLERVYDALNGRYFSNDEKNILKRQLKNIGLFSFDNKKDIIRKVSLLTLNNKNNSNKNLIEDESTKRSYQIKQNPFVQNDKKEEKKKNNIYGDGNLYFVPKHFEYKPWIRHRNLNSEAEKLLGEFHIKTHFKAAEEIAENKIITKKEEKRKKLIEEKKREKKKRIIKDPFFFEKNHFKEDDKIKEYIPYEKNKNPINEKNNEVYDQNTLNIISKIAFKDQKRMNDSLSESKSSSSEKNKNLDTINKKKLIDENNVLINGELYYKDTQFDIIAEKVLKNCNVYQKKSKHNNSRLIKGEGKNMITGGMSVNEFERKYKLGD